MVVGGSNRPIACLAERYHSRTGQDTGGGGGTHMGRVVVLVVRGCGSQMRGAVAGQGPSVSGML